MKKLAITIALFLLSACASSAQKKILIVYHSETGNTERMAGSVAEGARSVEGIVVMMKTVEEVTEYDLRTADAIILGSPVYNAAVSPEMSAFIASWPFEGEPLKNKIGAAFVTSGGMSAGEELVQMSLLQSMLVFGMIVVGGPDWTQPFGASAVTSEAPFNADYPMQIDSLFLEKGQKLGERVSQTVLLFNDSD